MAVLKQEGMLCCDSDMLNMAALPSTDWQIFLVHGQGCYQAEQLYSYSLPAGFSSHLLWILTVAGPLEVWSWLFVEEIKASIKCLRLIWQHDLKHDNGAPVFVLKTLRGRRQTTWSILNRNVCNTRDGSYMTSQQSVSQQRNSETFFADYVGTLHWAVKEVRVINLVNTWVRTCGDWVGSYSQFLRQGHRTFRLVYDFGWYF